MRCMASPKTRFFREHLHDVVISQLSTLADDDNLATAHVVYASNPEHFLGLLGSMLSLSRHLAEAQSCWIHVLVEKVHLDQAEAVLGCFRRELAALPVIPKVTLHELRPIPFNTSQFYDANFFKGHDGRHTVKAETYARFYLHEYLPTAPRALWIDTDTIVRADIRPLYQMRLRHALAAVPQPDPLESYLRKMRVLRRLPDGFRMSEVLNFFNAGVLLLDLQRWREENFTASLEQWVHRFGGIDGDQLALNLEFNDKYHPLDWHWNFETLGWMPWQIPDNCASEGKILHWSGPHKPWNASRVMRLPNEVLWEHPRLSCTFR